MKQAYKTPYRDYARYALGFYARRQLTNTKPKFYEPYQRKNWEASEAVFAALDENERELMLRVYASRDTLADSVYEVAALNDIDQGFLWKLTDRVERSFAKRRGLA